MARQNKQQKSQSLISRCRRMMLRPEDRGQRDTLLYWQQTMFVTMLLFVITLGIVAAVSGFIQFSREGNYSMAAVVLIYYMFFLGLAFFRPIRYRIRLTLMGLALYAVGLTLLVTTGPYGAGLMYLCMAYVHLALNVTREMGIMHIAFNGVILGLLSLLYYKGALDQFRITAYGSAWWIIIINLILMNIFITQMIGFIVQGMERRFRKERKNNKALSRIRDESAKQIRLLKSLRQMGNCISDTRLELSERLQIMQESLHTALPLKSSAISLMKKNSGESTYISSIPDSLRGISFRPPPYTGPFLMESSLSQREGALKTAVMQQHREGDIYFGSLFYAPGEKGFLELLLKRPPDPAELEFLQMNMFQLSGAITNEHLIRELEDSKNVLENSYDEILVAWARILELRDIETKGHCHRVAEISSKLAELLNLSPQEKLDLQRGAFLHDIGKLAIPDSILHKESSLSQIEWDIMRRHPQIGRDSVLHIPFLHSSLPVIYHHHERWDGRGYPEGLTREKIPIPARIFTIADVYDALTSDRSYRKALSEKDALSYMASQKGQIFDPEILEIFLKNNGKIIDSPVSGMYAGGGENILNRSD